MKKFLLITLFVLIAALFLTGCQPARVVDAHARDTIFSVEKTVSGSWSIFLTHDESIVYCTQDEEIGKLAENLIKEHPGEVLIRFKNKKWYQDSEGTALGLNECQGYYEFTTVVIIELYPVSSRVSISGQ